MLGAEGKSGHLDVAEDPVGAGDPHREVSCAAFPEGDPERKFLQRDGSPIHIGRLPLGRPLAGLELSRFRIRATEYRLGGLIEVREGPVRVDHERRRRKPRGQIASEDHDEVLLRAVVGHGGTVSRQARTPQTPVWFDTPMDVDERRILELERGFRREGLPNLIVDLSVTEDIFTRAIPFLSVVFVLEIVNALDVDAGWVNLLLALGGAAVMFGAIGMLNVVRGRRFLSVPHRVGVPELVAFVLVPALLPVLFSGQFLFGFNTILVNLLIVGSVYLVVGFGLVSIVRWVGVRLFVQLRTSMTVLVRAVPLLLFFSLVIFFTQEIWLVFTTSNLAVYWSAVSMFVLLAMVFLSVRLPGVVREVQAESEVGIMPLRRRERLNLAAVALISEGFQVVFVSAGLWLFYVLLGILLVSADVRGVWLLEPGTVMWEIAWFGEHLQVTTELLRVATGVAAFASLYYAVTILVDPAHRDQFVDALSEELRGTFERRSEYLDLLQRRGVAIEPTKTDPASSRSQ